VGPGRDVLKDRSGSGDETIAAVAAALRARPWTGQGWRDAPDPRVRAAEAAAARDLLARARRHSLPTLTIRGERREAALVAIAEYVDLQRAAGRRYVRIVTGKGLGSPGEPVLQLALDEWCRGAGEGAVSAWAPEPDADGAFGAVILRLRPRRA
jgi:hypothetical protein